MLIVCAGPDTFRSLRKAKELELAFCKKYDAVGLNVDHLEVQKDMTMLAGRLRAVGLFSSRRFVRCDGLLSVLAKAERKKLAQVLAGDQESTIVVTREEEAPAANLLADFKGIKIVQYHFPMAHGADFLDIIKQWADEKMLVDRSWLAALAEQYDGDAWLAWQMFLKKAVNPQVELESDGTTTSLFDYADRFAQNKKTWREVSDEADTNEWLPLFVAQMRTYVRVRDRATTGLHPFVIKKLGRLNLDEMVNYQCHRVMKAMRLQRSGFVSANETESIM